MGRLGSLTFATLGLGAAESRQFVRDRSSRNLEFINLEVGHDVHWLWRRLAQVLSRHDTVSQWV
jgi:hypothetical protein